MNQAWNIYFLCSGKEQQKTKKLRLFSFIYSLNFFQQNREKRAKVSHWVHIGKTWKTDTHTHTHHR